MNEKHIFRSKEEEVLVQEATARAPLASKLALLFLREIRNGRLLPWQINPAEFPQR